MATITTSDNVEHLELFSLVWLDDNLKEDRGTEQKLRTIINHLEKFHDVHACQKYIEERSKDDRIVLIVNGRLGRNLVAYIHNLLQVSSIYVYCMNKQENEQWAHEFAKIKKVVIELDELVSQIQDDYKIQKKVSEPLSITYSTTEVKGQFVFSQCLIDCLLRMETDEKDKNELISRCMAEYKDNNSEKARIHEFQTSYLSSNAIWWYTRESFVYKTLNSALRKQTIHMMFLYRSFIFDLWEQLAEHQSEIKLKVYRSQLISIEELDILKRNINQLISVNSFFSSSCDRDAAVFLLGDTGSLINSERVLFEIEADPRKANSKPFSDISRISEFTQEAEVLFMLGSIFRVKSITEPAEEQVWIIRLELCSDDEHNLSDVLTKMKSQNGNGQTNLRTLGKILSTMGKLDLAEYYYQRFLDRLSADDSRCKTLYEDLAEVASQKGDFDASVEWKKKTMQYDKLFTSARRNRIIQISPTAIWAKNGVTIAEGRGTGEELNQLYQPEGLTVDDDGTVFIADCGNHRIVAWKHGDSMTGRLVAGGNGEGDRMDQLNDPTDVVIDKENDSLIICDRTNRRVVRWSRQHGTTSGEIVIENIHCCGLAIDDEGNLYVTDSRKHEVKRYRKGEKIGIVVAGGNGEGHGLNQLNSPNKVCVDREGAVYVSEYDNHRVTKWARGAREGIVVAGGREEGDDLRHLSCPQGIAVDAENTLYVADMANHRIIKWPSGMKKGEIIAGGNGDGEEANQFKCPLGLCFNRHGDLYVTDWDNHRVQLFYIDKKS